MLCSLAIPLICLEPGSSGHPMLLLLPWAVRARFTLPADASSITLSERKACIRKSLLLMVQSFNSNLDPLYHFTLFNLICLESEIRVF